MGSYYEQIMVWKRLSDGTAVRFTCFRDLQSGKYGVQSADYFRSPVEKVQLEQFAVQFLELFTDVDPRERCTWFDLLTMAIQAHEEEFA